MSQLMQVLLIYKWFGICRLDELKRGVKVDRLGYETRINDLLDYALNNLSTEEFEKLLKRVKSMIENYY